MKFIFTPLEIPAVIEIEHQRIGDGRGFFSETWKKEDFRLAGLPEFVQENHSRSAKGVLRGLHYQRLPRAQGKLIRCIRGSIYDVAVDLRKGSPTFGRWVSRVLSDENRKILYVPVGFAHGFCVISDEADILYSQTDYYAPQEEGGIRWDDPDLAIPWPIKNPILSDKDVRYPPLKSANFNF